MKAEEIHNVVCQLTDSSLPLIMKAIDSTTPEANQILKPDVISSAVAAHYHVGAIRRCSLIRRAGFNHNYLVEAANGTSYVFRVYLDGKYYVQSHDDLRFELDLLLFLISKGLPVVQPIATLTGDVLGAVENRSAALFHMAKGVSLEERMEGILWPQPLTHQQYVRLGELFAKIHVAADEFETQHHRYHLNDQTYLLDVPLELMDHYFALHNVGDSAFFRPFAENLRGKLNGLPRSVPVYGIIHADLHPGNIFIGGDDDFTIIDFDHCAYGWRAYDLAPFYDLEKEAFASLLEGYESERALSVEEKGSFQTFVTLREVWDIGDTALYMPLWGENITREDALEAKEQLSCLVDPPSCEPSIWVVSLYLVLNTGMLIIALQVLRKTVRFCWRKVKSASRMKDR